MGGFLIVLQRLCLAALILSSLAAASHAASSLMPDQWQSPHYRDHDLVGRIFDGAGQPSTPERLATRALVARFLLLGEIHNNPDHHLIQAELIKAVVSAGRKPTVVLEMVPERLQVELDAVDLAADMHLDELAKRLEWEKRGWYSWEIYRPMMLAAARNDLPLRAGNVDRSIMRQLARSKPEDITPQQRSRFGLDQALPASLSESLTAELVASHCNLLPKEAVSPMARVQIARDHTMARALLASNDDGAILIAGSGHVRRDRGVPFQLDKIEAGTDQESLSIGLLEVSPKNQSVTDYNLTNEQGVPLYDFVVFTPKFDITDHCIAMREQFKKPKNK